VGLMVRATEFEPERPADAIGSLDARLPQWKRLNYV
jgi:hypothetical protein